ncbi:hypothetical protein RclHR1_01520009 [Rhizophagus clarus]|uniref:BTB domain-containing protein n=1 Tax=Rhizophagus clarus TaxID=94130 RepID=A0A2Z6QTP4_9GLOM|nr:hypothetical protein RclHR1_01520009 [Rhizophagus clarus]GES78729.1 hypothetical protein GLOIN_2v1473716 [Rhizophagus clarus]
MTTQFFSQLSQNFINILDDDEYYDITIEVGKDPIVRIFRAHMIILNYRSVYFRRNLSTNKKNSDGALTHIKLPDISPNTFQIILKYIYGGILNLDDIDTLEIIDVLVASEILKLQEIVNYLQSYLIENKSNWIQENFTLIHNSIFQHASFVELQNFCTDFMSNYPEKIFNSINFTSIQEKTLISLIRRDDLKMEEIDIWDHVLKWGLAQNPTLLSEPQTWSDDDFKSMEITLQKCLPFVRFFQMSSKEFLKKVVPYQKLLKSQLYNDLMSYYLDGDSQIISTILPARVSKDSNLITNKIASYIASWIDKKERDHPTQGFTPYNFSDNPYEFKLLLRGSRDGFFTKTFLNNCGNKLNTVIITKVKGTDEILGGYNPEIWKPGVSHTKNSFIFSITSNNLKNVILSRVINSECAISFSDEYGPRFGNDLLFYLKEIMGNISGYCQTINYEKIIRLEKGYFEIEEYEVFQIVKKDQIN